jgi:hypothetical protein
MQPKHLQTRSGGNLMLPPSFLNLVKASTWFKSQWAVVLTHYDLEYFDEFGDGINLLSINDLLTMGYLQ